MAVWWLATSKNEGHCSYLELKYRKIVAQGWPDIGDISALLPVRMKDESAFIAMINDLVTYVYNGWNDSRNPGRVINNLLKISKGDFVLCTEGECLRGIARMHQNPNYRYDNGAGYFEYAQTVYPVTEWKEWDSDIVGEQPAIKAMGPVGINHYNADEEVIIAAWDKLPPSD